MSSNQVYQKLEDLVEALNPAIMQNPLTVLKVSMLTEEIRQLSRHVREALFELFFHAVGREVTTELIGKCYLSLVVLINKAYRTRHHHMAKDMNVSASLDELLLAMDKIYIWFHQNFNAYIHDDLPYPITTLMDIRAEILENMDEAGQTLKREGNPDDAVHVVFKAVRNFIFRIEQGLPITKREVSYHQDILEDLKHMEGRASVVPDCPSLHEMLIYWNLNTRDCIIYFRKGLQHILQDLPQAEKLGYLRLQQKYIQQLPERHDYIYDKRHPCIKSYFNAYLTKEIDFMKQTSADLQPVASQEKSSPEKIICNLSVDQISLLLRALYDLRVVSAKSMSIVFKLIVRYLATPNTENISWENMRKKCYTGERRDILLSKEIALQVAAKIETY